MDPAVVAELLKLGTAGVMILGLIWALNKIFGLYIAEIDKSKVAAEAHTAVVKELQEARIREAREANDKMHAAAQALNANTKATEALGDLVREQRGR